MNENPTPVHVQSWTKTTFRLDQQTKEELRRLLRRIIGSRTGELSIHLSQGGVGSIEFEEISDRDL